MPANVMEPRLMGVLQLLQQSPQSYHGFGWLWWTVKAALKAQVSREELYLLGPDNDARCVQAAAQEYGSADRALDAALDHYRLRAFMGQVYASDDNLPDGRAVRILDEDAGPANLL